jgi:hypothetical protein
MEQNQDETKTERKKLTLQLPKYHYLDMALSDFIKLQGKSEVFEICKEDKDAKSLENKQEKETKDQKTKLLVVDVRTEDFGGGFIPNAVHIPYYDFDNRVGALVTQTVIIDHCTTAEKEEEQDKKDSVTGSHADHHHHHHKSRIHIVFHCMYSRERGPSCATSFLARLEQYVSNSKFQLIVPAVSVLMGGFTALVNHWVDIEVSANQDKKVQKNLNKLSLKKEGVITQFDSGKWCTLFDEEDDQWKIFYKEDAQEVVALSPKPSRSDQQKK